MEYSTDRILALISHIHTISADFTKKFLVEKGKFASSHGFILFLLGQNESLTMGELSKGINRNKSTTTVLIKKLQEEGLVKVCGGTDDCRTKTVSLTQKGRDYNSFTSGISKQLLDTCWKDFSNEEKETLLKLLKKMDLNLTQETSGQVFQKK
ncbi:MAG: MarR family transcriptional regulator [Spirochaetales bacterium]|nr:MarR family transcriptional regulator [Spirochaetales bacterium]